MTTTAHEHKELTDLAARIHAWQQSRGKNYAQMCREFPGLGSDKTYGCIREGRLDGFDLESQLVNYRSVWAIIEALDGDDGKIEQIFDDLDTVNNLRRAVLETMKHNGIDRVVIVQAISGGGKTTAAKVLCGKYGPRCLTIEIMALWKDSPSEMLRAILAKFGQNEPSHLPSDRMRDVQKFLNISRRCLIMDEAHHLGPNCLNTIKALVNTTPGEFVLLAIPTLWNKLEGRSYQEARQIATNRLSERVKFPFAEKDVTRFIRNYFSGIPDETAKAGAKLICPVAISVGAFRFVRSVCDEVKKIAGDAYPDAQLFSSVVTSLAAKR